MMNQSRPLGRASVGMTTEQKLQTLVRERRSKFTYVIPESGKLSSYGAAFLVTAANITSIPVLLSLA